MTTRTWTWTRLPILRALALATLGIALFGAHADAQSWRTVTRSQQLDDHDQLDVRVRYGAGEIMLTPTDGPLLYRMQLRYDEDEFDPVAELDGSRLELGVTSRDRNIRTSDMDSGELTLELSRDVPMNLDFEMGAVKAEMDLGGLTMRSLSIQTGASETLLTISEPNATRMSEAEFDVGAAEFEVQQLGNLNAAQISVNAGVGSLHLDFTGEWERDADVSIQVGLGTATLQFPEGLGVRIDRDGFLLALDSEGLVKRGDSYYSPNWDTADRKVTVDLEGALGKVDVVWVR